jgi:hypothetical protein
MMNPSAYYRHDLDPSRKQDKRAGGRTKIERPGSLAPEAFGPKLLQI